MVQETVKLQVIAAISLHHPQSQVHHLFFELKLTLKLLDPYMLYFYYHGFVLTENLSNSPSTPAIITFKKGQRKRARDQENALPNPYPLPQNFPAVVEAGLSTENPWVIPRFLSSVASSMLCCKQYPTQNEYVQVAHEIITKFPWMRAKLGPPTVSD